MNQNTTMLSLLPYLDPKQAQLRLDIAIPDDSTGSIRKNFPFRVLSEASPVARLLRADIRTPGGSLVNPVFLLVQKDEYRYQPTELCALTNVDMAACWQQAHIFFSAETDKRTATGTAGQTAIRLEEAPLPFQSLFFCSHRQLFFHPPCPMCGRLLEPCTDDTHLATQGLNGYTTSLQRYLYCPSCPPGEQGSGFYVKNLDASDSARVQDCSGLISAWRHLLAGGVPSAGFPCINCQECDQCHGSDNQAATRIIPFGFYPFHMLIFKAMTVSAADFLPVLSGASFADIEKHLTEKNKTARLSNFKELKQHVGRGDLFLFAGQARQFLEILYLKLSFLNDVTELMHEGPMPLDIHAALDCLWVKVNSQNSLLPQLWNFRAGYMDIGLTDSTAAGIPPTHPLQTTNFIGLIWFYTLVANATQPAATVIAELADLLEKSADTDPPGTPAHPWRESPTFAPHHIFWAPNTFQSLEIPETWESLWEDSLALAWGMLSAGHHAPRWSHEKFRQTLSVIRQKVKNELFTETYAAQTTSSHTPEDRAIHEILTDVIRTQGRRGRPAPTTPSRPDEKTVETMIHPGQKQEEMFEETLIVSRGTANERPPHADISAKNPTEPEFAETVIVPRNTTPQPPGDTEPELAETVVVPRNTAPQPPGNTEPELAETVIVPRNTAPQPPGDTEPELAETIVQTRGNIGGTSPGKNIPAREAIEEELPETVVISKNSGQRTIRSPLPEPPEITEDIDGDLPETIILAPGSGSGTTHAPPGPETMPSKALPEENDDVLSETVILRPQSKKDNGDHHG